MNHPDVLNDGPMSLHTAKAGITWRNGEDDRINVVMRHMINISGNRDHSLLDICVLTAIQDITNSTDACILDTLLIDNTIYVRPRATLHNGEINQCEDDDMDKSGNRPLSELAFLNKAVFGHHAFLTERNGEGEFTLWMPIWQKEKLVGCLKIVKIGDFQQSTLDVIEGTIMVYRNFMMLLDYSERDSLTGLLNRKTFDDNLSRMQTTSRSTIIPPTVFPEDARQKITDVGNWLAIVDIDHFKNVNDTFGHLYGDEVLILVANFMKNSFRSKDRVFRFGGEEFVVLLRCATIEDTKRTLERFRKKIEDHSFPQVGKITISIGFTGINSMDSPVVVLGHADQALYYAKENGRNKVCFYDDLVTQGSLKVQLADNAVEFF